MKLFLGTLMMWSFGSPLYLPWILARLGIFKRWYLAPFAPPLMWGKAIYGWPASTVFLSGPILAVLPINDETFMSIWATVSMAGVVLAILMILWTPRWAKPKWQLYLEDHYEWHEIRRVFIPFWRTMSYGRWSAMMDSEEGIEELVKMARDAARRP